MAQVDKVAIGFSRRVIDAPADARVLALTRQNTVVEVLARPGGHEAAILTVSGEEARQLEANGPHAAGTWCLSMLADVFGNDVRTAFAGAASTRWGQDVYARGAWSAARPGREGDRDRIVLAQPHDGRVFFAGEATDSGSLAGAYSSGVRAATEALTLLDRR